MNLNRLRYFVTVVETGSMRKAAELLHITPAALSKAIDQLERETGVELVVPDGRGIRPSARGAAVAQHARRVLDEVELLEAFAASASDTRAIVRLGTSEVFGTYFLGQLIDALGGDVALTVHSMTPGDTERGVADGTVDIGLTFVPVAHELVVHTRLASVRAAVYTAAGAFDDMPFESVPFAVPSRRLSGSAARASTADGWPHDGPLRNVLHQVGTIEAALEVVRQRRAACYVPEFVVAMHNAQVRRRYLLAELDCAEHCARMLDVYAVTAANRVPTREAQQLLDTARQLLQRAGGPRTPHAPRRAEVLA